jgi:hypothetical protein
MTEIKFFNDSNVKQLRQEKQYSLDCSYYTKTFPTLDELVDDICKTGMDPNHEITLNGKPIGEMASDHIAY